MYKVTYNGITYRSLQLACDRLGIHPNTVRQQYKYIPFDQAIEQILKNKKRNSCTDHLGNEFESIRAMAEFYHIPYNTLYNRLKRKWSLKRALTTPNGKPRGKYVHSCIDHLGNEFESRKAMAEFYSVPHRVLNRRLEREWSLERALTTPNGKPRGKYAKSKV